MSQDNNQLTFRVALQTEAALFYDLGILVFFMRGLGRSNIIFSFLHGLFWFYCAIGFILREEARFPLFVAHLLVLFLPHLLRTQQEVANGQARTPDIAPQL